jgi:hypothetical protein
MSYELPFGTIKVAIENLRVNRGLEVDFWPYQTRDKHHNGTRWFALAKRSEGFGRQLILCFNDALEVFLPGDSYRQVCNPQITKAITNFWLEGEPSTIKIVEIRPISYDADQAV